MKEKSLKIRNLLVSNHDILLNKDNNNGICYDGIVKEEFFRKCTYPVMVLTKETNANPTSGDTSLAYKDWDYISWIKNQQVEVLAEYPLKQYKDPFYPKTFKKFRTQNTSQ